MPPDYGTLPRELVRPARASARSPEDEFLARTARGRALSGAAGQAAYAFLRSNRRQAVLAVASDSLARSQFHRRRAVWFGAHTDQEESIRLATSGRVLQQPA